MLLKAKRTLVQLVAATCLSLTAVIAHAKTELTMYYPVAVGGPLTKIVDGLVADFMKANPDIDVKAIYAGNYNDARVKALAALNAGQPAQLSVMFSIDIYELIEQDAIVAFDDIVSTDEERAWLNSFYSTLMENGRTAGKTWGIPFQRSTIVMYYNKDAFRAAGLDPESPPATWEELVAAGKKLTKADGSQWGAMIPSTGYPYWMFGALAMQAIRRILMRQPRLRRFSSGRTLALSTRSCLKALSSGARCGKTSWRRKPPSCGTLRVTSQRLKRTQSSILVWLCFQQTNGGAPRPVEATSISLRRPALKSEWQP